MKKSATPSRTAVIVRLWWEKWPAFRRIEIANRSCSAANFWETSLRVGRPRRGPNKAFHSPAPAAAATPSWPANPGLCSSRAIGALRPGLPATSLSSYAVFAPARRLNFSGFLSPCMTVRRVQQKAVFTHTQLSLKMQSLFACIKLERVIRVH
jgi:hypothetical protein